jgi:hypothetical protein
MTNETAGWYGESPHFECGEDVKGVPGWAGAAH